MTKSNLVCTVCDIKLVGEYCHKCGQHNTGNRITFLEISSDFISGMFSLERSVLATFWLIIRQPAKIINNYWTGWRGYYHSPGKMAFYAAFILGLHFAFLGNELLGINFKFSNAPPQLAIIIFLVPLYTLTSKLTFFRIKHSFLDHLIAMIYIFSIWIIVFIFIDVIQKFVFGKLIDEGVFLAFLLILFIWNTRIHSPGSRWYKIIGYTLIQLLILVSIIAIAITIMYLLFPETINVEG